MSALLSSEFFEPTGPEVYVDQGEAAVELLDERASMVRQHQLFGFVPNPKQMEFIEHDTVKRKGAVGGNQMGKTTIVVVESFCHAIGCRPYLPADHPNFRVLMPNGEAIPTPNKGQMCGEDFPVGIGENLWPAFEEWVPGDMWTVRKHERGIPRIVDVDISAFPWADPTSPLFPYSRIYVHAYQQGRASFQGVKCHWVMDDEPPTRPVYIEQMRGLIRFGGKWMGAMTCVEAEHMWIYDLFLPSRIRSKEARDADDLAAEGLSSEEKLKFRSASFYMVQGTMFDNLKRDDGSGGLEMSNIEEYKEDLGGDEIEIAVRIHGQQLNLLGTEFGRQWDEDILIVPHREPNVDNMHVVTCDAHPHKPYAITWWEINQHNEWYAWHESYSEDLADHDAIAEYVKRIEGWQKNHLDQWVFGSGLQPAVRLIDPIAKTYEKGIGMTAIQYYRMEHDILWTPWTKGDKIARTKMTRAWLKPGKGPTGRPRLTFSEECELTIHQMPRYRLKPLKDPTTQPVPTEYLDVDADMVQGVIAVANSGLTFDMLAGMMPTRGKRKVLPIYGTGNVKRGSAVYRPQDEPKEEWERDFEDPWKQRRREEVF